MSGHSHFSSIKHKKAIADSKRSKIFSKVSQEIAVAVREGGGANPETNDKLKLAIEKAKKWNLPKENIERALKRGSGEAGEDKLETVIFEAYGPGKTALIIEGITDNKNRTLGEIKQILNKHNGKLANEGSVKWMFERKGCLSVDLKSQTPDMQKEKLEMLAIEAGAEDLYWHENTLDIYTKTEDLEIVKKNLEEKQIQIESTSLDWVAKEEISTNEEDKEKCQKLFEDLDENDSVQEIYSNLKS